MEVDLQPSRNELAGPMPAKLQGAMGMLLEAARYADETGSDPWDLAVEIHQLRRLGLLDNDLRYLVRRQFALHACETSASIGSGRGFRSARDLCFTKRSCFVLTVAGIAAAAAHPDATSNRQPVPPATIRGSRGDNRNDAMERPFWDSERRKLFFGGRLVKHFRWLAANQEKMVCAFQDEDWPPRMDDPLTPSPDIVSKRRLSDAIKCLNRKQANRLLCFRGDGTGEGVSWEPLPQHANNVMTATA